MSTDENVAGAKHHTLAEVDDVDLVVALAAYTET
jgi:hypothetical protein